LRIGFIISKRTGGAVLRNKIKRVIKETLIESKIEICGGLDILFKINKDICSINLRELKKRLQDYMVPCPGNRFKQ